MSLENTVSNFADWLVANALPGAALQSAVVHDDCYEEMNSPGGTKFIRIDNLLYSKPLPAANGQMKELNAVLEVQFLQIPVDQTLPNRKAARAVVNAMALEFLTAAYNNRDLRSTGHEVCNFQAEKRGDWVKVGNVKTPRAVVSLLINPEKV